MMIQKEPNIHNCFINYFLFSPQAIHREESNYSVVLKGWCHDGCLSLFLRTETSQAQRAKSGCNQAKKGDKKEEWGPQSSLLFSSQGRSVGLKSRLTELQHWIYFSWCDSTAAKSQLQLGSCRAGGISVWLGAGTPAVPVAGCSCPAISHQLLAGSQALTAIVCKH